jgi:predicted Zn-dependent peptidase
MNSFKIEKVEGLRTVFVPDSTAHSLGLAILVKVGSRYETANNLGLAHFYEHLCFRGTKKYPDKKQLALAVDQVGADFNGATDKEDTNFHIKLAAGHWRLGLDILSQLVVHPLLRSSDIKAERPIILEEIKMRRDHPRIKVIDRLLELLYPQNSLGLPTAGSQDSVSSLARSHFTNHRQAYFTCDNLVLIISGKINDLKGVKTYISDSFSSLSAKRTGSNFTAYKKVKPQTILDLDPESKDQFHLAMGWPGFSRQSKYRYPQALLDVILGSGMSSRLFQKIREDAGLAYFIGSDAEVYQDTGFFAIGAGIDKQRISTALELIHQELANLTNPKSPESITQEELQKAKDYVRGKMILRLEDPLALGTFLGIQLLLEDRVRTLDQVLKIIDGITLDQVLQVAKSIFQSNNLKLAGLGGGITKKQIKQSFS